jgi:hypothetical protein
MKGILRPFLLLALAALLVPCLALAGPDLGLGGRDDDEDHEKRSGNTQGGYHSGHRTVYYWDHGDMPSRKATRGNGDRGTLRMKTYGGHHSGHRNVYYWDNWRKSPRQAPEAGGYLDGRTYGGHHSGHRNVYYWDNWRKSPRQAPEAGGYLDGRTYGGHHSGHRKVYYWDHGRKVELDPEPGPVTTE